MSPTQSHGQALRGADSAALSQLAAGAWQTVTRTPLRRAFTSAVCCFALWAVAATALPKGLPPGTLMLGLVTGALSSLIAIGLVIVYRSSRIINFAQADFGAVAATLAILLVTRRHWSYFVAVPLGLVVALATGALTELVVVRRFFRAPRLILTVATIGVAQVLSATSASLSNIIKIPSHNSKSFSQGFLAQGFSSPFHFRFTITPVTFNGDTLVALVVLPLVVFGLTWFFSRTDSGIAVRAAADSQTRAVLLGIPVRRLSLLTWTLAAGLSGLGVLLTAGVNGYSVGDISGPTVLVPPLAAAVIARFESLTVAVVASLAIGVFSNAVYWSYPKSSTVSALLFVVILLALLVQRKRATRVTGDELGGFLAVREPRRLPDAVRRLPELRRAALIVGGILGFVAFVLPQLLSASQVIILTFTAIYAIVGISLVVLSGWAGQLSFGQFAFVGLGAGTTGGLLVHAHADYLLCLLAALAVGAVGAVVIGIPALRIPGLYLAPVTMAFAVATSSFVMDATQFPTFNPPQVQRPMLFSRISLDSAQPFYYLTLALLLLVVLAAHHFRRSRIGRVVIAVRDNERMAAGFSLSSTRVKLVAFAFSGGLAGLAGGIYVLAIYGVPFQGFSADISQQVFAMAVVGGLASITGGILGAVYVFGAQYFLSGPLVALVTGAGILFVLMFAPGGIAEILYGFRDRWLRRVLRRHNLDVPTLASSTPRAAPRSLTGVSGLVSTDALCAGTDAWRREFDALGKSARRRLRKTCQLGRPISPPEHAALAVGWARNARRMQKRYAPAMLAIPFVVAFVLALLASFRGHGFTYAHEFATRAFWTLLISIACYGVWQWYGCARSAQANLALVRECPTPDAGVNGTVIAKPGAGALLDVRNLDAGYGHLQVLFGAEASVGAGEIVALLGTNGAGKTTTLGAIAGSVGAMGGEIFFDGEDISGLEAVDRVRRGIVMVPSKSIFGSLSVRDNLRLGAYLARQGRDTQFVSSQTERVLTLFPVLRERLNQQASLLSGGEQQMLAIAQGLLCKPKLLMIDELSLGLSPMVVASILDVVQELNRTGIAVLVVEQSVNVSTTIAARAMFMEKGQVRFSGPTSELAVSELLNSVFMGGDQPGSEASSLQTVRAHSEERRQQRAVDAERDIEPSLALEAVGLNKHYGGVRATSDLNLVARRGQILGIIGANGAGKTTAFDIFSGFTAPDSGTLRLHGREVTSISAAQRAALGLGRTFQDVRMMPSLTVAESLAVALERHIEVRDPVALLFNVAAATQSELLLTHGVDELVDSFGLGYYRDHLIADLSTGTRRIVELACAAAHQPSVLLLDEPTSGLAQREAEAMAEVILDLKTRLDATVLIVEHDVPLVSALADELVCMHLGTVIARGAPDAVLADPQVVASYLGSEAADVEATVSAPAPSQPRPPTRPADNRHRGSRNGHGRGHRELALTTTEFATLSGLTASTVLRHIHDGRIDATRIGRAWRIPATELDKERERYV